MKASNRRGPFSRGKIDNPGGTFVDSLVGVRTVDEVEVGHRPSMRALASSSAAFCGSTGGCGGPRTSFDARTTAED